MKRKYPILILIIALILIAGCNVETFNSNGAEQRQVKEETIPQEIPQLEEEKLEEEPSLVEEANYIKIAPFNIQIFGQSKIKKPEVMNALSRIIRRYDVVAIQEVRSKEQNVIPALLNLVNDENTEYDYVVSERLGRTISKEQYAFVYNTETVS